MSLGVRKLRSAFRTPPVGAEFGYVTVLGISATGRYHWGLRCRCGNVTTSYYADVLNGRTRSCGCYRRPKSLVGGKERSSDKNPEYSAWAGMKSRCNNPATEFFHLYGGRGIRVCAAWREFANFYADMGDKPSTAHSIDRIDSNGHYSCGRCDECAANDWAANCRWATTREQTRNKSNNRWLTYNGETMVLNDWAARLGISPASLRERLRAWPIGDALSRARGNQGGLRNETR